MLHAILSGAILGVIISQCGAGAVQLLHDLFKVAERRWVGSLFAVAFSFLLVATVGWQRALEAGTPFDFQPYLPCAASCAVVAAVIAWFTTRTASATEGSADRQAQ